MSAHLLSIFWAHRLQLIYKSLDLVSHLVLPVQHVCGEEQTTCPESV